MTGFSIIICTYNPSIDLLQRLFKAVNKLETGGLQIEVLLVDNNSNPPLKEQSVVLEFLLQRSDCIIIRENQPGLTAARIAGIRASKFDWLVFFDDDNEPSGNYLLKAAEAITAYPQTVAWGAAEVEVEYIGTVAPWLLEEKALFQQRNDIVTVINNRPEWQDCYPAGTGLIINNQIALLYVKRVNEKCYTLTDRKGKSLSSGGDVQLVLTGIEQGFYAGIIGGLKIRHLIDTSKASLQYLQKLQYGTASAYLKAYNQVFIHSPLPVVLITNRRVFLLVYSLFRIYKPVTTKQRFRLLLASKMGELNARAEVTPQKKRFLLKLYERIIGI
jgi:glycosyltransferase involved in cell wall biosynthesis